MEDAHQAWLEAKDQLLEDLELLLGKMNQYKENNVCMVISKDQLRILDRTIKFVKYAKD